MQCNTKQGRASKAKTKNGAKLEKQAIAVCCNVKSARYRASRDVTYPPRKIVMSRRDKLTEFKVGENLSTENEMK